MNPRAEYFHLAPWPWAIVYGGIWLFPLWEIARISIVYATVGAFLTVSNVGLLLWLSVLKVANDGLVLSHFWHLKWDQVARARVRSVVGLKYIYVHRIRGLPLWIPLYLVGRRSVASALTDRAPEGNPIRTCLVIANKPLQPTR